MYASALSPCQPHHLRTTRPLPCLSATRPRRRHDDPRLRLDPVDEAADAGVDRGVLHVAAGDAPRGDADQRPRTRRGHRRTGEAAARVAPAHVGAVTALSAGHVDSEVVAGQLGLAVVQRDQRHVDRLQGRGVDWLSSSRVNTGGTPARH